MPLLVLCTTFDFVEQVPVTNRVLLKGLVGRFLEANEGVDILWLLLVGTESDKELD